MRRISTFAIALILILAKESFGQEFSGVLASFYPPALDAKVSPGMFVSRRSCFVTATTKPDGSPSIVVAGYTNGVRGAVRVLQSTYGGGFEVVSDVLGLDFTGNGCSAIAIDLDGDGLKEILMSFVSARGNSMDWIFRLNGTALVNLSPTVTQNGSTFTTLMDVAIVDLFHDGKLQIIDTAQYPPNLDGSPQRMADTIYRVGSLGLTGGNAVFFNANIIRDSGAPKPEQFFFDIPANGQSPSNLHIANGNREGGDRVSSARIWLNDIEILRPSSFNQNVEFIDVPIGELGRENSIRIVISGAPGSRIFLTLQ